MGKKATACVMLVLLMMLTALPMAAADAPTADSIRKNNLVMMVGSDETIAKGETLAVDTTNTAATPYLKNGTTFVPISFIAAAFGGTANWDAETKSAAITYGEKGVVVRLGEAEMLCYSISQASTGTMVSIPAAPELKRERMYLPLRAVAEGLGLAVFYDRGIIIIGEDAGALEAKRDESLINELIGDFTDVRVLGSKERLVELLGYDPEEDYRGGWANGDMIVEESVSTAEPAPMAPSGSMDNKDSADTAGGGAGDYSQTNTQVDSVDEADIIKTDGDYIYYLNSKRIEIIRAYDDGSMDLMAEIAAAEDLYPQELFVDGDKMVVIGSGSRHQTARYSGYYMAQTMAVTYDISDRSAPKVLRTATIDGDYLSSRRINDSVYLITKKYLGYGSILPTYSDTAVSTEPRMLEYSDICYFPIGGHDTFVNVVGIDIGDSTRPMSTQSFLGSGENIYMSESNLYIACTDYAAGSNTSIYKFAADDGQLTYSKKGTVPGYIINQFSMDEHKGYFRIGTTESATWASDGQSNGLYVLNSAMEVVGKETGIAPGERIYSVRFMGDRAYMVTFKQTDPLFAIDLSSPENPKVMGALKIPGYSNYLHPYDENHLIGFGRDTYVNEYGRAYDLGMKISMFDVTDIENPKEMFVETIGDRGTSSALLSNHKALMMAKDKGIMAFPVTLYEKDADKKNDPIGYGKFVTNAAYVYEISLEDGFALRGTITHLANADLLKASEYGSAGNKYVQRIIYIKDRLYTLSGVMVLCNDMNTLQEKGAVAFSEIPKDYDPIISDVIGNTIIEPMPAPEPMMD